jgi:hypothetical protein
MQSDANIREATAAIPPIFIGDFPESRSIAPGQKLINVYSLYPFVHNPRKQGD